MKSSKEWASHLPPWILINHVYQNGSQNDMALQNLEKVPEQRLDKKLPVRIWHQPLMKRNEK